MKLPDIFIRRATSDQADVDLLWQALYEAAHLHDAGQTIDHAKSNPSLARYVAGWGRPGDLGFIAEIEQPAANEEKSRFVGAAWLRLWPDDDRGYGYVNPQTPELAIGVIAEWTGRGVGSLLLKNLLESATAFPAVSLSVRLDNRAVQLYKRFGFAFVSGTQMQNRAGGQSATMIRTNS